ncbi:MAG: hypothetical protein ACR2L5_03760 [Candidatus Actinomarinaceae bacterium]
MTFLKELYCNACDDNHFLLSNNRRNEFDLQKCDECNYFKSDKEAKEFVLKYINNEKEGE